jgi:preprotein translocase subunit SecE
MESRRAAIVRAFVTVVLVTIVVAAVLGGATYVASRALVGLMS